MKNCDRILSAQCVAMLWSGTFRYDIFPVAHDHVISHALPHAPLPHLLGTLWTVRSIKFNRVNTKRRKNADFHSNTVQTRRLNKDSMKRKHGSETNTQFYFLKERFRYKMSKYGSYCYDSGCVACPTCAPTCGSSNLGLHTGN